MILRLGDLAPASVPWLLLRGCPPLRNPHVERLSDRTYHASLADEWLPLLLNTNLEESISFVKLTFTTDFAIGFAILLAVLIVFAKTLWHAVYPSFGCRNVLKGTCLAGIFAVLICLTMNFHFGIAQMTYSLFALTSIKSWTEGRGIRDACRSVKLPETLSVDSEVRPDCVIVLGESATRNSWHLYGYSRHTTPRVDQMCGADDGGVAFTDIVGIQPVTDRALALLLTDVSFDDQTIGRWTLAEVYRRAGYRCVLISHQWGGESDLSTLYQIFNGCERRLSVRQETKGKE